MNATTNETAARLRRAVTRLSRKLRNSSLSDVTPAQVSMLASIDKLGSPSLGDLAAAEQIQPPSVTQAVKTLERDGLIVTFADESDRRCTRVRLSPAGKREITAIRQRKTEFLERKLLSLSFDDQRRAEDLVALLELLLEEE